MAAKSIGRGSARHGRAVAPLRARRGTAAARGDATKAPRAPRRSGSKSRTDRRTALHVGSRRHIGEGPEIAPPSPLSLRVDREVRGTTLVRRTGPHGSRVSPRRRGRTVVALHIVICRAPSCGRAVHLCTLCNIPRARYCGRDCRQQGRRAQQREAGGRYQRSRRGRRRHALRQRRYRARLRARQEVTHQRAPVSGSSCRVEPTTTARADSATRCARCGRIGEVIA